ncbi:MAG: DUF167 domain-containing protein [Verrucomicrobiota bacterium]
MSLPTYLRAHADGVYLAVKVQPRASKNEIGEPLGHELKVKVTAPPVDSAANEALLRFLADQLNCPRGAVALVRGQTSRHKVVFIRGLTVAWVQQKFLPET